MKYLFIVATFFIAAGVNAQSVSDCNMDTVAE